MDRIRLEFPNLPERLLGLGEMAENLWWSWHPAARMVFKSLNRQAWKESLHNPDKTLKELSPESLAEAAQDQEFLRHYDLVLSQFHKYLEKGVCSRLSSVCDRDTPGIAYFSAEYGLHHSLPFYAGGLGFLAGDFIKECSDLQVPLVAVGFMYPEGYVLQRIREDGWQENLDQPLDREAASIYRVLDKNGRQVVVKVPIVEPPIYVSVWKVEVGRVELYLLDTDIEPNDPWNRSISSRLYAGDIEQRLRQEIVLGIGGMEVLERLGIRFSVLHLNEGHAAFALLERIRDHIQAGLSFEEASKAVSDTTVFTTHTPVPAGHDVFPFELIDKYFHNFCSVHKLEHDSFLRLGIHPEEPQRGFNMTAFALRLSGFRNSVSRKHGEVASRMWQGLTSDTGSEKITIQHVTNGVHVPTWIEPKMELLFNKYLGPEWLSQHENHYIWELVDEIPDSELWDTHMWLKIKLIDAIRERARRRWTEDRLNPSLMVSGGTLLDPTILTLGFARRFTAYKRADLIFHNMERLKKLLTDRWQPIQIIFAGKAHPADDPGKRILQRVVNTARDPEYGGRIAFVEDYGEQFAQYLVHGVDVWLNNPLPPMEACGTSGMKAGLNGVPSLSILDGWWLEGYNGKNGWAFGAEEVEGDRDKADAEAIYSLLEEKIIPLYYKSRNHDISKEWLSIMKESIKVCGSHFSARRMVSDYINKFYIKALQNRVRR
ncbi:MAG: alpha-glucan family phosphorylase [Deltaproteobacteria bacterium]|nr:alpha-glucan family phosphorylase [Deltaproteobacteria bacterium]